MQLNQAVECEEYELAASLRDRIRELKNGRGEPVCPKICSLQICPLRHCLNAEVIFLIYHNAKTLVLRHYKRGFLLLYPGIEKWTGGGF